MIFDTIGSTFRNLENEDFTQEIWLTYWYPKICQFLELSSEEDIIALKKTLSITRSNYSSYGLKDLIKNKKVYAVAPGIHLEEEIARYSQTIRGDNDILIAADGATAYLVSKNIIPDIIVTDFDGDIDSQLLAQKKGSILLLHIHGDNYKRIQTSFETLSKGKFLLTTQIDPLPGSYNFYGFTDGDRIVCLATLMDSKEIYLIGYDFGTIIGEYSKTEKLDEEQRNRKMKKFVIGKSIINWCHNSGQKIIGFSDNI